MGEYNELTAFLRRVRSRWCAMTTLRAWTFSAAAAALVLLAGLATHRLMQPDGTALIALWAITAATTLVCLLWVSGPMCRRPGDRQVARFIEECCPELEDTLVTAVAEREHSSSRPMFAAVVGDAARRARDLDVDRIVSRRSLRRAAMAASAATVALLILGAFSVGPAGRAARVTALYLFPESIVLEVTPGDAKVRAGQSLRIQARIPGVSTDMVPVIRYGDGKEWRSVRMEPDAAGAFAFAFDTLEKGFKYSVSAASASSREYTVTVIRPPRVEQIDLRYEYPAAFGLKPRVEEDSGDIYGPAGTRVRVSIRTDKPVVSAALNLTGEKPIALKSSGDLVEGELLIAEDGSYRIALADADGLSNAGDTEYFIRTLEDRPPDVRILRPAGDRQVTPIEEVTIDARADDDFGVSAFDLVYSVRGGEEKAVPFRRNGSGMTINGQRTVYLEDMGVAPGDFVTYYARARDVSRGKRSSEARSDIFFLEVKPFEEEFVAAQSQAMGAGGGGDRSLDDLAEAQKDIIVATWKLDARSRNARSQSEEDVRNVGRAQAELRKRAQAAAGQLNRSMMDPRRRRMAQPGGGTPAQPVTEDPMSKAVDAMGKAQQQLEAIKTAGALPHEMNALNELLRAQAEVRRRQVQRQQQSAGGRGGSNRQQQDLSSLFDRELQRQQSTNYETPNSSETREEKTDESDALDRIKELARRQDALNRAQQDLAKRREQMTEEELRRELEKLTREQSELRRQAEELSRQMQQGQQQGQQSASRSQSRGGQQGQSQGQGQGQSQNSDNSRALREASEEMQNATSDLRRQDPKQASARGSRALDKLRETEQRMRSAQPDDRRRALGEAQLESRQLADAQRQLSGEGAREGQGTNADASRRRAAEQERLADRMQRLERSVKQLAAGAGGGEDDERKALADASRELERQKLSERMRNAARAAREGQAQSGEPQGQEKKPDEGQQGQAAQGQAAQGQAQQGAKTTQRAGAREGEEIARQLERLAERLGSANGQNAESRRISEQLSRTRELREKLADADRQIGELRRKGGERQGQQAGEQQQGGESAQEGQRGGQPSDAQQQGDRQASSQGQQGATGQQGTGGGGRGGQLTGPQEGQGGWEETRKLLGELRRENQGLGIQWRDSEGFNPGISAPGSEAWKQDFAKWDELKTQIAVALEKAESSLASQLREHESKDRLNAGTTQAVPEQYRRLVDKYYRALARKK